VNIGAGAAVGKILWHFPLGIVQTNSPQSFLVDGPQYVVVAGGDALCGFYLL
jgi:alcohol dehydrogenase (cytochrome c)